MEQRSPSDVMKLLKDSNVEIVDVRFCDLPGLMQHFSIPAHELSEDVFEDGLGFDGSSIRGFQEIQESDMLLIPDPNTPMLDQFQDLRSEMVRQLEAVGIAIEVQHHEVGTAGQAEIDMRFDELAVMADKLMLYKYVVKNVARAAGYSVTFMPKPLFMDNGSGMHVHQSLWKGGEPLFFDEAGYGGLSDMARWYIGGLLRHAPAILAFSNPTTNSYKRLVPGYEAPVNLVYSQRNRSAAVRIPLYSKSPKAKRLEFRCPD